MHTNRIRHLRQAKGLSLAALGELVGSDRGTIWRLETGATKLDLIRAQRIAEALQVRLDDVLGLEELPLPGLREDATPYQPADGDPFARLAGENQFLWTITTTVLDEIGIAAGNVVLVDISAARVARLSSGEPVLVTVSDPSDALKQAGAKTLARQFVAPRLLITNSATNNAAPLNLADGQAAIMGVIVSWHRRLSA